MTELKPCPFCGGKATIIDHWIKHLAKEDFETEYSGNCRTCGAETRCYKTEDEAAGAWNRREAINDSKKTKLFTVNEVAQIIYDFSSMSLSAKLVMHKQVSTIPQKKPPRYGTGE